MAYKILSPEIIIEGGTDIQSSTAYAPICGGTTNTGAFQSASSGMSNSGYLLTSTGSSSLPTWQTSAAGGITGAFTPVLNFGGSPTGITYSTQLGEYFYIGNIVFYIFIINLSSKGSFGSATVAAVSGFPVTPTSSRPYSSGFMAYSNITLSSAAKTVTTYMNGGSGFMNLIQPFSSIGEGLQYQNFANNSSFTVQGFYLTS